MIKIVTLIGARPQIIKAAALSRAIRTSFSHQIKEIIVHTGQHYDENMSQVFIDQLQIPQPDYNLNVGSGSHGRQTARMLEGIEEILMAEKPRFLVVYGDTNSTIAGALAAAKIHVPVVHIEAGLRSFNKKMPEEVNRIACDHMSTLLFTPTLAGLANLQREGFTTDTNGPFSADAPGVFHCGDVMFDNSLYFSTLAAENSSILTDHQLHPDGFILCTIHRDHNTDDAAKMEALFETLIKAAEITQRKIVVPLHPRTNSVLQKNLSPALLQKVRSGSLIHIMPPVSFFDMIELEKHCHLVMTDSGGVQKEAYFFEKPVVILRNETEWVEIAETGAGRICGSDPETILAAIAHFTTNRPTKFPPVFGDGQASSFICRTMLNA